MIIKISTIHFGFWKFQNLQGENGGGESLGIIVTGAGGDGVVSG